MPKFTGSKMKLKTVLLQNLRIATGYRLILFLQHPIHANHTIHWQSASDCLPLKWLMPIRDG